MQTPREPEPSSTGGAAPGPEGSREAALSDEELEELGGAQGGAARKSWIVKDSEQELPDSEGR